ncbi:MAG: DNA repair protein RadC [Gammaproteobacteria bacterium]|nr:MAG: DNA repair protein RadC [Gammaproteobacteria bacterium]
MSKVRSENPAPYLVEHTDDQAVIDQAIAILDDRIKTTDTLTDPDSVKKYLRLKLSGLEHEVFSMLLLDTRHHVIDFVELFRGTIDGASVYPREVVKEALNHNAAAVILCHNHPSNVAEPSQADEALTKRLKDALALIDVWVLDHIVIGGGKAVSFAERGLL